MTSNFEFELGKINKLVYISILCSISVNYKEAFCAFFQGMDSWSKEITFGVLCDVFEAVSKQSDKTRKMLMLKDFLGKCR